MSLFEKLSQLKIVQEFRKTFRSLKIPSFRTYTIGQLLSLSGTWMQSIALSWLVYSLTGSAAALGMVALASGVPMILLTYFGGMIADRFDRRRVLMVAVSLNIVQASTLAVLTFTGLITVPWIIGLALFNGCVGAVEMPTRQSFVPELIPKEELTNAIGINSAVRNSTRILGPAAAGMIIGLFGEAICFGINALSYVAAFVTLMLIKSRITKEKAKSDEAKGKSAEGQKSASIWSVLNDPKIKGIMLLSAATSMFGFQYTVLLPVIVDNILLGDASTLGFLSAFAGVGALLGSLTLASRGDVKVLRRGIGFASLCLAVAIALIGYSSSALVSTLAVAIAGASISLQLGGSMSIVQTAVDNKKRGRVMAVFSLFMVGFAPFAAMFAGWMAEMVGVSSTLYLSSAAVMVSAALYLLFTPKVVVENDKD